MERIRRESTDQIVLFNAYRKTDACVFEFPDQQITLSGTEMKTLESGKPLDVGHPLSRKLDAKSTVVLSKDTLAETGKDESLFFALTRAYPKAPILREFSDKARNERIKALKSFRLDSADKIFPVIAEESFQVTDWATIQNMRSELLRLGLKQDNLLMVGKDMKVEFNNTGGQLLIVITGHIDLALERFIESLGKQGVFKGNLVIVNTCNEKATRALIDGIVSKHGALAVISFEGDAMGRIYAAPSQEYILNLVKQVGAGVALGFFDIIKEITAKANLNAIFNVFYFHSDPQEKRIG